jgi:hypothetical protein
MVYCGNQVCQVFLRRHLPRCEEGWTDAVVHLCRAMKCLSQRELDECVAAMKNAVARGDYPVRQLRQEKLIIMDAKHSMQRTCMQRLRDYRRSIGLNAHGLPKKDFRIGRPRRKT